MKQSKLFFYKTNFLFLLFFCVLILQEKKVFLHYTSAFLQNFFVLKHNSYFVILH